MLDSWEKKDRIQSAHWSYCPVYSSMLKLTQFEALTLAPTNLATYGPHPTGALLEPKVQLVSVVVCAETLIAPP